MTAVISAALRKELLDSAREKLPKARADLISMYTAHATRAMKTLRRKFTDEHREAIVRHVDRMLKL